MKPFVWEDHANAIIKEVARFYINGVEVDCTLVVEGRQIRGHKLILCASSLYFQKLFMIHSGRRPIPVKGVKYQDLENIFTFIYYGLVEIPIEQVSSFIKTAKLLEVTALKQYDCAEDMETNKPDEDTSSCTTSKVLQKLTVQNETGRKGCVDESSECQFKPLNVSNSLDSDQITSNSINDNDNCKYLDAMQIKKDSNDHEEDTNSVNNVISKDSTDSDAAENTFQEAMNDIDTDIPVSNALYIRPYALDNFDGKTFLNSEKQASIGDHEKKDWQIVNDIGFHSVFFVESDEEKSDDNSMDSQESHSTHSMSLDFGSEPNASTSSLKPAPGNDKYKSVCHICSTVFSKKINLEQHLRTHTGEKPYSCASCPASFADKGALAAHEEMHTGEKPFVCNYCSETFAQRGDLKEHLRSHKAEKRYSCKFCPATFSGKSNLDKHARTHTGERPFVCTICYAAFTQRDTLITHVRTHTGEKPFGCDVCGAAFTNRSSLTNHSRTHTGEKPFACHICSAAFAIGGNLKKHVLTHAGVKPFRCDQCSSAFSRRVHLQRHMLSHTGEKPFKCTVCPIAYTRKVHLMKHLLTHKDKLPTDGNDERDCKLLGNYKTTPG